MGIKVIKSFTNEFSEMRIFHNEVNMGLSHNIVNGIKKVFKEFDALIVLEDDIEVSEIFLEYMNEALLKYRLNKKDRKPHIGLFKKAIELETKNGDAFNNLANTELEQGSIEEAIENYKNALALNSNNKINIFINFSLRPSNEFFFKVSSALMPLSELILGSIGLDDKGLKLHRNGKL